MSRKREDNEPASEQNKEFDPGEKGREPPLRKADVLVFFSFSGGTLGLNAWLVSFAFACLSVSCLFRFVSYYRKNQVIIFLRDEENMGGEKKTNGDTNQVDEERNRRASIFLPINPFKINTSGFGCIATRWGYDRYIPGLVTRFSCS